MNAVKGFIRNIKIKMNKIVIIQDLGLNNEEIDELKKLGNVAFYDDRAKTSEEWLQRCQGADIICTGQSDLRTNYDKLKNVFLSLPFVGVDFLDRQILKNNNITVSNSPGCNKDAVAEWIIAMILNLFRDLPNFINSQDLNKNKKVTLGLRDKKAVILGKGNIGTRVGEICEFLNMKVAYFKRGDDLIKSVKNSDVVVNTLSYNDSTNKIINKNFFQSLKQGSYFVSVADDQTYDADALEEAIKNNILAGAAIDFGSMKVGDINNALYKRFANNPKVLATPHMAYNSDITDRIGNKMMIENIKAWIKGKPINLVK